MGHGHKLSCVLCQRADETKITGALSTKDQVTAHQNCLLFSSGIYCRNSPQFDDLFGFSVEDVKEEVKRGSKLLCSKCKKRGATAGCEVKRCKKSYHYPCAVQEGAKIFEDADQGNYGLYCINHCQQIQENGSPVNGCTSSFTKAQGSKSPNEAGPSKVFCLTCEKTEGNISLESLSNSIMMSYCDKHTPSSHKRKANDESTAAGSSLYSSDSNSSSSAKRSKRSLNLNGKQEGTPSKFKPKLWKRRISDDSFHSDEGNCDAEIEIFAPLEFDSDESANSVQDSHTGHHVIRGNSDCLCGPTTGNQLEDDRDGNANEDETIIHSESESESLLAPVVSRTESRPPSAASARLSPPTASRSHPRVMVEKEAEVVKRTIEVSSPERSPVQSTAGPSVPRWSTARPHPSPDRSKHRSVTGSPLCTRLAVSPSPPEAICLSRLSSTPSLVVLTSNPEPSMDSSSFWKSCNAAGCTHAIFADFINEMKDISGRIQSDRASKEDYNLALRVIEASGKLGDLVSKQQKELQRKQVELQKAAAAMRDVISALRR
ncbi:uncharacterized protein phf11 [Pempheris klunzingeri]|uniref:uncharacterized protein phf11 n=1 Tax=Pempheris klunzingeri TaxID=3127111 RepID=UPI003981277B